jgi:dipeptidyl aminopeptidase/acylaminoacyl peptidase
MFTKRGWSYLLAFLIVPVSALYEQDKRSFSLPDSVLLFAYPGGELRVVTPDRVLEIKPPVDLPANHGLFNYPSISPRGDLIAWGFATADPHARHGVGFVLGIYSIAEQKWRTYGALEDIGATAFSPDGSKIAFSAEEPARKDAILIFDVATGKMTNVPHPRGIPERGALSWSPDGKRLVVETHRLEKPSLIVVLDPSTGEVQPVGEGYNPSWSPTGEWIAYYASSGEKCMIIHPDGTGAKMVSRVKSSFFTVRAYSYGAVWSPDGKKLLLNESRGENRAIDVVLLDLETGRTTTKTKNGFAAFGWIARGK